MVGVRRFRHPETGNMVLFYSLPSEEQKRIHDAWAAKRSEHKVRLTRPEKLKELKSKNLPKRIFEKEKRRLVQEIEMRAMKREQQRNEEAAKPPTVKIEE